MTERLHTTELGEGTDPDVARRVLFCHGLFGQGRNFTAIGKELADRYRVSLVDLPDHGQSPRSERFSFVAAADQVADLLAPEDPAVIVGHSLGGKIAMLAALRHPERVERLVVVDVAPVAYGHGAEFARYISAMRAIDLASLGSRAEADQALQAAVPHPGVRGFLLQSLRADGDSWRWLLNLELLERDLDEITDWPEGELANLKPYQGRVLWIAGSESPYVRSEHYPVMDQWFPRNRRVTIKGAGHWVHSEQPEVFLEVLSRFLAE